MTFSLTVPDRIGQALTNKASEYEQTAPDYLKSALFTAAHSRDGFTLKLDLPAVAPDPRQAELNTQQP